MKPTDNMICIKDGPIKYGQPSGTIYSKGRMFTTKIPHWITSSVGCLVFSIPTFIISLYGIMVITNSSVTALIGAVVLCAALSISLIACDEMRPTEVPLSIVVAKCRKLAQLDDKQTMRLVNQLGETYRLNNGRYIVECTLHEQLLNSHYLSHLVDENPEMALLAVKALVNENCTPRDNRLVFKRIREIRVGMSLGESNTTKDQP